MQLLVTVPGKYHAEKLSAVLSALGAERNVQIGVNGAGVPNGKPILDEFRKSLSVTTGASIFWTAQSAPWDAIRTLLSEGRGRHALLFYEAADIGIARQLQAGASAEDAVEAWLTSASGLLDVIENKPEGVTLVQSDHALLSPRGLVESCAETFGFELADATVRPTPLAPPGLVFRLAAEALLARAPEVQALNERLEGYALRLASSASLERDDIDQIVEEHRALHADRAGLERLTREADALRKENQRTELSLRDLEQQLDDKDRKLRLGGGSDHLRDLVKGLEGEAHQLRKVLAGVQAVAEESTEEASRLMVLLSTEGAPANERPKAGGAGGGVARPAIAAGGMARGAILPASLRAAVRRYRPDLLLRLREDIRLVEQSELFDAAWYTEQNADVREKGVDPAKHFVRYGGHEGRSPGPFFCSARYLKENADVARSGVNPLVHYVRVGKSEGRKIYWTEAL